MIKLDAEERRALRGRGHALHPVVTIGDRGLAESVVTELGIALDAHELIKVRLPAMDRDERAALSDEIVTITGATRVQSIGRVILLYRPRPESPPEKEPARRTTKKKRSVKRTRLR